MIKVVFVWILFVYCLHLTFPLIFTSIEQRQNNDGTLNLASKNIDVWIGEYEYYEFLYPDINYKVEINISKKEDEYVADICINGFQVWEEIEAKVVGNENEIYFLYQNSKLNNPNVLYVEGEVLFKFYFQDGYMLTDWEAIKPHIIENQSSGNIRFIKNG